MEPSKFERMKKVQSKFIAIDLNYLFFPLFPKILFYQNFCRSTFTYQNNRYIGTFIIKKEGLSHRLGLDLGR